MSSTLLKIRDLYLHYSTRKGPVHAVDGVYLSVNQGESIALIGESGCGKSSLAKAIIRLLPRNVHLYKGEILLDEKNIMKLSDKEFRESVRWTKISMVAQAALNSLNPVTKIGEQVAEPLIIHEKFDKKDALERAKETLSLVGLAEAFTERYPFELSGGMRQRTIIAMALITNPQIVILDEPTSALDVLTQANIMNLLKKVKDKLNLTYILITHDVAVSSELADKVAVMYAGQIVEFNGADDFYKVQFHPYSIKLMASVPTLRTNKKLEFIPGAPPSLLDPPKGCRFAERCPKRFAKCDKEPPIFNLEENSYVKCWLYEDETNG